MSAFVTISVKGSDHEFEFDCSTATTTRAYKFLQMKGIPDGYFTLNGKTFLDDHFEEGKHYGYKFFGTEEKEEVMVPPLPAPKVADLSNQAESGAQAGPGPQNQHVVKYAPKSSLPLTYVDTRPVPCEHFDANDFQ